MKVLGIFRHYDEDNHELQGEMIERLAILPDGPKAMDAVQCILTNAAEAAAVWTQSPDQGFAASRMLVGILVCQHRDHGDAAIQEILYRPYGHWFKGLICSDARGYFPTVNNSWEHDHPLRFGVSNEVLRNAGHEGRLRRFQRLYDIGESTRSKPRPR